MPRPTPAPPGWTSSRTLEIDGEGLDRLDAAAYDAVISRVGLIYFPDQQRALAGMRHVLREGGRVAAVVYSTPERNAFFSRAGGDHPAPCPAAAAAARTARSLLPRRSRRPGRHPRAQPASPTSRCVAVESPVRLPSAAECVRFERESFGALHQMMRGLSEAEREETWAEIEESLAEFEGPDGFVGPCEMLVGAGTR